MIVFKPILKKNPRNLEEAGKYYAAVVSSGDIDLDELAYLSSKQSTVSKADCYAVIITLLDLISMHLKEGKTVRLGGIGNFRVSLSSEGTPNPEELSANSIKKARILFSPGTDLKNMLKNLTYSKISE